MLSKEKTEKGEKMTERLTISMGSKIDTPATYELCAPEDSPFWLVYHQIDLVSDSARERFIESGDIRVVIPDYRVGNELTCFFTSLEGKHLSDLTDDEKRALDVPAIHYAALKSGRFLNREIPAFNEKLKEIVDADFEDFVLTIENKDNSWEGLRSLEVTTKPQNISTAKVGFTLKALKILTPLLVILPRDLCDDRIDSCCLEDGESQEFRRFNEALDRARRKFAGKKAALTRANQSEEEKERKKEEKRLKEFAKQREAERTRKLIEDHENREKYREEERIRKTKNALVVLSEWSANGVRKAQNDAHNYISSEYGTGDHFEAPEKEFEAVRDQIFQNEGAAVALLFPLRLWQGHEFDVLRSLALSFGEKKRPFVGILERIANGNKRFVKAPINCPFIITNALLDQLTPVEQAKLLFSYDDRVELQFEDLKEERLVSLFEYGVFNDAVRESIDDALWSAWWLMDAVFPGVSKVWQFAHFFTYSRRDDRPHCFSDTEWNIIACIEDTTQKNNLTPQDLIDKLPDGWHKERILTYIVKSAIRKVRKQTPMSWVPWFDEIFKKEAEIASKFGYDR